MKVYESAKTNFPDSENRFYQIGKFTLCLSFSGSELISRITPAFEHLAIGPIESPDLTVYLWDSISTKTKMVPPPWKKDDYLTHGIIRGYNSEHFQTGVSLVSSALSMLDLNNNKALWWIKDARSLPISERGSPILAILDWWLSRKGFHFMHAGAVGTSDGGALLVGVGGSGKSTAAISCVDSPLSFAADDYCLLTHNPLPRVYSIYNSGKLDKASVEKLAHLNLSFFNETQPNDEKSLFFLYKCYPDNIIKEFSVKAVLLLKICGKVNSSLEKISAMEALKTIAPNTLFQFTGVKETALKAVVKLVDQVPCYRFHLGTDINDINRKITDALLNESSVLE